MYVFEKGSLCPGNHYVDQNVLKHTVILLPLSAGIKDFRYHVRLWEVLRFPKNKHKQVCSSLIPTLWTNKQNQDTELAKRVHANHLTIVAEEAVLCEDYRAASQNNKERPY